MAIDGGDTRATTGARRNAVAVRLAARVPRWYSPVAHLGFNLVLTAVVVSLLGWQLVEHDVRRLAWLSVPAALVFANAVEYAIHRFPMHRRMRLFDRFFRGHTLVHHRYFDHQYYELKRFVEAYFVLTTAHTATASVTILAVVYFGMGPLLGADVAALATITMALYSLANEVMHLSFHLPSSWLDRLHINARWFLALREHHLLHHDPRVMRKWNFNIVMPLMDWIFGTRTTAERLQRDDAAPPVGTEVPVPPQ